MGLDESVALITGGRFSGATRGGAIALIEEGDPVRIDIPGRRLELPVAEAVLARRRAAWQRPCPKIEHGYLRRYAAQVTSAGRGAVLVPGGEAGGGE
jgi:dihydroxy-acid dehydratase